VLIGISTLYAFDNAKKLKVGFLHSELSEKNDREVSAAIKLLKKNVQFDVKVLSFSKLKKNLNLLNDVDVVWYHRPDSSNFTSLEKNETIINSIRRFTTNGGGLLLSLDAFRYLNILKLETEIPKINYVNAVDKGYGRKLGIHSLRSHPIFDGLFGGAYIWAPYVDQVNRQVGFFDSSVPKNGKVVAVDWAYITLKENSKIVVEYEFGKGKVLAIGAYTYFAPQNFNRRHLEIFTSNCLKYLSKSETPLANEPKTKKYYWDYQPPQVKEFNESFETVELSESKPWKLNDGSLTLSSQFASNNYYNVSAQRILIMGKENAGIAEVWAHPFMAFRDYEVGVQFSYRDTIYWFRDQRPQIEVKPESFTRTYRFPRAFIKEVITADIENPVGIIHYEYRGLYPAKIILKYKSNLRFMWPYSEKALGSIYYSWNDELNAFISKDVSGDFYAILGSNKKPVEKSFGQFDHFTKTGSQFEGVDTEKLEVSGLNVFDVSMNDNFDVVIVGTNEGKEKATEYYNSAIQNPPKIYESTSSYYKNFLKKNLMITTPDKNFNEGYRWAMIGTDKFFVNTPGIGKSLVAGYSTTARGWDGGHKVNGRPGYAWYFGRDGQWSGLAILGYGDFEKVKSILEVYQKFQDVSGKIYHELTTSGVVHYDAADATPLFIILAGNYLRWTGDIEFIKNSWDNIKRAMDFLFSTDTDNDNLIENTNVGHGWVEGGSLYGAHTTLYLAGCWAEALNQASFIARELGYSNEANYYLSEYELVRKKINEEFWNTNDQFFYYGKFKDGTFNPERTVLPAVPLYFQLADNEKAYKVIDIYAENGFTSDWGVRILSEQSPLFNPRGYHYGSVWPLFTGWTALAEYKNGNYLQGYSHIMNNLLVYKNWSLGYVEEVLNGAEYLPSGVCPHQCWSQTMVLQPIYEGMLGLNPSTQENKLSLSLRFPFDWDFVNVENIKIGHYVLNFEFKRQAAHSIYNFVYNGDKALLIDFNPSFPPGTVVQKVLIDGQEVPFDLSNERQSLVLKIKVEISSKSKVEVYHNSGISVLPTIVHPIVGESSKGFRILSSRLSGKEYVIEVQGRPKHDDELKIYSPIEQIKNLENAKSTGYEKNIYTIKVNFEESLQGYINKVIRIKLK
jgi:glycogen debranching enzyme